MGNPTCSGTNRIVALDWNLSVTELFIFKSLVSLSRIACALGFTEVGEQLKNQNAQANFAKTPE